MVRFYVGCKAGAREVFTAECTPTAQTHGTLYAAVIGPFRTKRGAQFMALCGGSNPHVQCVNDAERIAKELEHARAH